MRQHLNFSDSNDNESETEYLVEEIHLKNITEIRKYYYDNKLEYTVYIGLASDEDNKKADDDNKKPDDDENKKPNDDEDNKKPDDEKKPAKKPAVARKMRRRKQY